MIKAFCFKYIGSNLFTSRLQCHLGFLLGQVVYSADTFHQIGLDVNLHIKIYTMLVLLCDKVIQFTLF